MGFLDPLLVRREIAIRQCLVCRLEGRLRLIERFGCGRIVSLARRFVPIGAGAGFKGVMNLFAKKAYMYKPGTKTGEYLVVDALPG